VLLNSDVEVTPNWIENVLTFMSKDKLMVACQPKILSYSEKTNLNMQEPLVVLLINMAILFAEVEYLIPAKR
jgi:GT2 family glycosyltransferase